MPRFHPIFPQTRFPPWILLIGALLAPVPALSAQTPAVVWPVPLDPLTERLPSADYLQPTSSGILRSALFGCVRNGGNRFHEGIDLKTRDRDRNGEAVDPVVSALAGRVAFVNPIGGNSAYGKYVVVVHDELDVAIHTLYAHLARIAPGIAADRRVSAGTRLGTMGRSATYGIPRSRAHLHLEVGLRLTDNFAAWYAQQPYDDENRFDVFNGMNLVGTDPLPFLQALRDGQSPAKAIADLPVGLVIDVASNRIPDFVTRYPMLVSGDLQSGRWRVYLTAWGFPIHFEGRESGDLHAGQVRLVHYDQAEIDAFGCREMLALGDGFAGPGSGLRRNLELIFGFR